MNHPQKLYKYRSFNPYTLRLLCEDKVYYAHPNSFNDPLDSNPTIQNDLDINSLKNLYQRMHENDSKRHIGKIFEFENHFGNNQELTIQEYKVEQSTHFKMCAANQCDNMKIQAKDEADFIQKLTKECKTFLDKKLADWGVLSLAKRWDCPLMWSHYADNHHGICIEYDTEKSYCRTLNSVDYSGQRSIKASDLMQSELHGSIEAWQKIQKAYFFKKASDWKYEEEWRCLASARPGEHAAPFRISGIYFGLRCDPAVIKTIFLLLCNQNEPRVSFYQINDLKGDYSLDKNEIDFDQRAIYYAGGFLLRKSDNRLLSEFII
ncbi:DUF2971 domain-containing protein [Methyloglobulus sp.]|uniref:DUF2971 domain-containing protein n=1 Tax=Methyloglobulus sp. TaxID=2518622 RepID=UPI0032B782FC